MIMRIACLLALFLSFSTANAEEWRAVRENDPLRGPTTYVFSPVSSKGSIAIIYLEQCPDDDWCSAWDRFHIHFTLTEPMKCPMRDEPPAGSRVQASLKVFVDWRIDDGAIFTQQYELIPPSSLAYRWIIQNAKPRSELGRHPRVSDLMGVPHDTRHGIPPDRMITMLSAGRSIFLRAIDSCTSTDIKIDLTGLKRALSKSKMPLPIN